MINHLCFDLLIPAIPASIWFRQLSERFGNSTEHIVQVFEYNGQAGFETYLDGEAKDNPTLDSRIFQSFRSLH